MNQQKGPRWNGGASKSRIGKFNGENVSKSRWYGDLVRRLEAPEVKGARYDEARRLIPRLIWWGHTTDEVFQMMRRKYSTDYTDSQLWSTIRWAARTVSPKEPYSQRVSARRLAPRTVRRPGKPQINLKALLATVSVSGCQWCPYDFFEKSPIRPEDPKTDQRLVIEYLFKEGELIALTGSYEEPDTVMSKKDGLSHLESNSAPYSPEGGWIYMNPVTPNHRKHITNQDIARYRYLQLDGDSFPKMDQLQLLGSIVPSVAAIVDTGNRGYHAWVRIDARDREEYDRRGAKMFSMLEALKFDPATKLPFCKSRMPSVHRVEKEKKIDGWQQLIYLNPEPAPDVIFPREGGLSNA